MDEQHNTEAFRYTYSAKQQEEIQRIRQKYMAPEEDKMEQLRRLDRSVTQKATTAALVVGILGALLLGMGMSLTISDVGTLLGIENAMLPGIVIGVIGIGVVALAYPLYSHIVKKERERIAPAVLQLTEELMK